MKKIILLLAVGAFFISSKSNAQQFVASFGVSHSWGIPQVAYHTINHDFYGYDVVHARRIIDRGYTSFDLILQRGDVFVEVHLGAGGRIIGRTYLDYYPLASHVCTGHCGFHRTYYNSHRVVCNSRYHRGHNHVVYNRRPVNVVYRNGHRYGDRHGHYNGHPGKGNAYGHYKGNRGRGNAYGHDKGNRGRGNAYGHDKGNRGRGNAYGHDKGNRGRGNAYGHSNGNRGRGNDNGNRGKGYGKNKNGRSNSSGSTSSGRRGRHYTSSRGN